MFIMIFVIPTNMLAKLFAIGGAVTNLLFAFFNAIKYNYWWGSDSYEPSIITICKYNYRVYGSFWLMELFQYLSLIFYASYLNLASIEDKQFCEGMVAVKGADAKRLLS